MTEYDFTCRIFTALFLGAFIGLERQWRQRMAGLRTNALVSTGAALFVALASLVDQESSQTRIAAQVVSGIGFLGAGVIMRDGLNIRGLNTAATLWCAAAVGILSGSGFYVFAAIGTFSILAANIVLRIFTNKINKRPHYKTEVVSYYNIISVCAPDDVQRVRANLLQILKQHFVKIHYLQSEKRLDAKNVEIEASVYCEGDADAIMEQVVAQLSLESGVASIRWELLNTTEAAIGE